MASSGPKPKPGDVPRVADSLLPTVLIINDDSDCISHCSAMLDELGYRYRCATNARQALEHLAEDSSIQVLLIDMQMRSVDGFVLIDEARSRAGEGRAMGTIMLAQNPTVELAVKGLHVEAVDLVRKPLDFSSCSTALRRATRYLTARRLENSAGESAINQQLAQLMSVLESKTVDPKIDGKLTDKEIGATLRTLISARTLRNRFFPNELFADPAWDILLDLTRAKLDSQQVSVSSVCIAASVPMSTALRWVRQMTEAKLLQRWTDPRDRRRDLIALTDATAAQMRDYVSIVHGMLQKL